MLILKRKRGQWLDITHTSGDVLRIRVHEIEDGNPGYTELCFDDDERNFAIERPERRQQQLMKEREAAAAAGKEATKIVLPQKVRS